ncbi:MAG: hypothetical protein ACM3SR_03560 [Ignavibacteriales bacterium]
MDFRDEYGDYSAQEAMDTILLILKKKGFKIDEMSFTWTLVGVLFDRGIISRQEFERIYPLLKNQANGRQEFIEKAQA